MEVLSSLLCISPLFYPYIAFYILQFSPKSPVDACYGYFKLFYKCINPPLSSV